MCKDWLYDAEMADETGIADRIRTALESAGKTQRGLADAANVTPQAVNGWLRTGHISRDRLAIIANYTGTSLEYLLTGKEAPRTQGVAEQSPDYARHPAATIKLAPVLGVADSEKGEWDATMDNKTTPTRGHVYVLTDQTNIYALRIEGDGLAPRYRHGEHVWFAPDRQYQSGDEVLIRTTDGTEMIRMYLYMRGTRLYFTDINYPDQTGQKSLSIHNILNVDYLAGSAKDVVEDIDTP